ncbi:MAG: RNA 2'-phosphotransferase [Desulfobacteraceae bacterium]|nr:RNA 2'-phosphotransferase [Desulfobacteraceae bacterium]
MKDLKDFVQLSKAVSHALRHEPWLYELELDNEGWVFLDNLISALRNERAEWANLCENDLVEMVKKSNKRRHEIKGGFIRALYGHSLVGKFLRNSAAPPERLYHGTSQRGAQQIFEKGLLPMGRQYVHLSINVEIAVQVGKRKDKNPVILKVAAKEAFECGVVFYIGNDAVWLANEIPPMFIK